MPLDPFQSPVRIWQLLFDEDLEGIATLLNSGPDAVSVLGDFEMSPLQYAANQFPEAVRLLLKYDNDPDGNEAALRAIDENRTVLRPLVAAADAEHHTAEKALAFLDAVDALLEAGADPNLPDGNGSTALHSLAGGGVLSPTTMRQITELLLRKGADVGARHPQGLSPLDLAYRNGNTIVAQRLVEAKAPLFVFADDASSWVHRFVLAALVGDLSIIRTYRAIARVAIDSRDRLGQTALFMATQAGHFEVVRFLVRQGADIMARCNVYDHGETLVEEGDTPVHRAAFAGHPDLLEFLLDSGADLNAPGGWPQWDTPLMKATVGAIFNQRDKAAGHKTMRLLIERGADVRARNNLDNLSLQEFTAIDCHKTLQPATALMYVPFYGPSTEIGILLQGGAVKERDDLLEAIAIPTPEPYMSLSTLWLEGRRILSPPLTLAEVIPYIDGRRLVHLLQDMQQRGQPIDVNERHPITGVTALEQLARLIEKKKNVWWDDKFTYEQSHLAALLAYN